MLNVNLNVTGETKYLANMLIYIAYDWKYQNKSSMMRTSAIRGLLQVVRRDDCAALLVKPSHLLSCCLPPCPVT